MKLEVKSHPSGARIVVLIIGLALLLAGTSALLIDQIISGRLAVPHRMATLPVFQYEQFTSPGTTIQTFPDDSVLVLSSSGAVLLGLAALAVSLVLRLRGRQTPQS